MTRRDSQLNLEPMEVRKPSDAEPSRRSASSAAPAASERRNPSAEPDAITITASQLFDRALDDAQITNAEAAHLMGISESLVNRMRSPNYRECVSLVQLLRCGPVVTWKFHVALHHKQQFGQRALREALQALSLVGVGIE